MTSVSPKNLKLGKWLERQSIILPTPENLNEENKKEVDLSSNSSVNKITADKNSEKKKKKSPWKTILKIVITAIIVNVICNIIAYFIILYAASFFFSEAVSNANNVLNPTTSSPEEKIQTIYKELGDEALMCEEEKDIPEDVKNYVKKAIKKDLTDPFNFLERGTVKKRLCKILEMPFKKFSPALNYKQVDEKLEKNYYWTEKNKRLKEEILADVFLQLNSKKPIRSEIICLIGPPGTGKSFLASAVAEAVGRKFVSVSLGGVCRESLIRGLGASFLSADCGKIANAMHKAKVINPVILLDEIDKIGHSLQEGDPAAALLEVLDSEQNKWFLDHYLGLPIDLSNVLFICTANYKQNIDPALLNRLRIIDVPSYNDEEKFELAKNYLLPRIFHSAELYKENQKRVLFTDEAIKEIIECTKDEETGGGVRRLKTILSILIKGAVVKLLRKEEEKNESKKYRILIDKDTVKKYLEREISISALKIEEEITEEEDQDLR